MLTLAWAGGDAPAPLGYREVNTWVDELGKVCARAFSGGDLYQIEWPGLGLFVFSAGSREIRVWPERSAKREAVIDTFSRLLQPVVLQAMGWEALHASAVAGPTGVIAFCGRSGSGKSTLAFALQQRTGWRQFSDDALVLELERDRVLARPLPFRPRLRPGSQAYFARARTNLQASPERELAEIPLTAVFLLRQVEALTRPRISPVPQARAFSQLLAHAHCFDTEDPTHTRRLVNDYLALSARVPVFTLDYIPKFQFLPQLTRALLKAMGSTISPSESRSAAVLP